MDDKNFEHVVCNLCGADDYETISTIGQFGLPAHVVICRKCGLTYLNPRWTRERYLHFYTHEYDDFHRPNINTKPIETGEPIFARMKKLETENEDFHFPTPSKILDVGSGAGANLNFFKRKFPDCSMFAIEPSDNAIRILEENNVEVLARDIDTHWHQAHQRKFDLIIMRHVLEHFLDPVEALRKVGSTLAENGVLYIAVPNNMKPKRGLKDFWFRAVHTHYFGPATMDGCIKKSGLNPVLIQEGDDFSPSELFTFVTSTETPLSPSFDPAIFTKQIKVFRQHERRRKSVLIKIKNKLGRLLSATPKTTSETTED